jgi:nitroreductase
MQHILLGAAALGIASMWSTGGMTHHKAMKDFFQLREEDIVMGIIYLGYSEKELQGRRITPIDEKIKWM